MRSCAIGLFFTLLATLACDGVPGSYPDDLLPDRAAAPGKADYFNLPFATFRAKDPTPAAGEFLLLANSKFGSFHREIVTGCAGGACESRGEEPLAQWTKGGSTNYVRFTDLDGNLIDRYAFELVDQNQTLRLRKVNTHGWQELAPSSDSWCEEESAEPNGRQDCSGQDEVKACVGTWTCESHHCVRACDYDVCGQAGAACVDSGGCTEGTVADALRYPCPTNQVCCFSGHAEVAFDPLAADNVTQAFTAGLAEAQRTMTNPRLSFFSLSAVPTKVGASYADTEFRWKYDLPASGTGGSHEVTVAYPGWTTSSREGMPMGAYLAQSDLSAKLKTFSQILDQAATQDISLATCPLDASARAPGLVQLTGSFGSGGSRWFWAFICAGQTFPFATVDATTGARIN
jgi:hypothetical protein